MSRLVGSPQALLWRRDEHVGEDDAFEGGHDNGKEVVTPPLFR